MATELAMGRLALRCLAVLLTQQKDRRVSIKKTSFAKLHEKYPGAVVRFGEETERVTARLATPTELDEADRLVAEESKKAQDASAAAEKES